MKAFKSILLVALVCALSVLGACATQPGQPGKSPAQIAAQVCPPLQGIVMSLSILALDPATVAKLTEAKGVVDTACAVGSTGQLASLQDILKNGLPTLALILRASSLSVEEQQRIMLDATVVQIILTGAMAAMAPVATSAPVPAAPASAAV